MTPATPTSRRAIGNFNGDFEELAQLIQRSWSENKEQPLRYTPAFLRSAFEYPGASLELAPAIYREGRLVGFIAGFPRTVRLAGAAKKLIAVSFLTVAPEHKRSGYGALLWGELWNRARAAGFDGTLNFCVEGDEMNRQMLPLARAFRQPTVHAFGVQYMARVLRRNESDDAASGEPEAGKVLMESASRVPESVPLIRVWSPEEARWQCEGREGALACALSVEGRSGIISGYRIETSGAAAMQCVLIDDLLWGDLTPEECTQLAKGFVGKAASAGARMVIAPVLNYFDAQPLAASGFRKTRRVLHAYLTMWGTPAPEPFPAMYIDVF